MNNHSVLSHLKIIKVEKYNFILIFRLIHYISFIVQRKIKIAKNYCENCFFFLHLIDEQLRMEEEGHKLWGGLDRQYWSFHLQKELQSKTLNTKFRNINAVKLGSSIIERGRGILKFKHLNFEVPFPYTDIFETVLITNYETVKEFLIFIKYNV